MQAAGAAHHRDSADARLVAGVRSGEHRLINSQQQVGGWPNLASLAPIADTDRDGMPDAWEKQRGLDPASANDGHGDRNGDGYTNLEEYLNDLCPTPAAP